MHEEIPTEEQKKRTNGKSNGSSSYSSEYDDQRGNKYEKDEIKEKVKNMGHIRETYSSSAGNHKASQKHSPKRPKSRSKKRKAVGEEWSHDKLVKCKKIEENQLVNRREIEENRGAPDKVSQLTKEGIEIEERRPKRKVAVLIGYAGTGYKGMQINTEEKTIEGDIFKAFIAAGAISKANADDPKKSSLVRCARTDKGVHAAGNVISLKLIVEDLDIVQKINENLPPQIRVWGYERTNGGFSCYKSCDSRWYEYLIPSYSFLPPNPQSFLGRKLIESAKKEGYLKKYIELQEDVSDFWTNTMEIHVKPILDRLDPDIRVEVMLALHKEVNNLETNDEVGKQGAEIHEEQRQSDEGTTYVPQLASTDSGKEFEAPREVPKTLDQSTDTNVSLPENYEHYKEKNQEISERTSHPHCTPLEIAIREVKAAYIKAKKLYRISSKRRARIQETLNHFIGTHNFHNYTIQKKYIDPSAKRVIKSFDLTPERIIMHGTEWLSIKVHGQSFMMHQIRKMIGMISLIIRCASPLNIIQESFGPTRLSIPKAPGLGLLLLRPVFNSYNERAITQFHREKIDFDKYKVQIDEFKKREIFERIFHNEERDHQFSSFFHNLDHRSDYFLWVTASGISAARTGPTKGEVQILEQFTEDETDFYEEKGKMN